MLFKQLKIENPSLEGISFKVNFDGVSGYLSDVGNTDEMAENALKILKDETVLAEFKMNALSVAKQFDIKNILPLYEDLYRKAINKYS